MRQLVNILTVGWFLVCLACQSGSKSLPPPIWTFRPHVPVGFLHHIDADRLGVKSADSYYILNKFNGQILDIVPLGNIGLSGVLFDDQKIYFGSPNSDFQCYDLQSREIVWKFKTRSENQATPVDDEQKVYWGSADSTVYAVDKFSGELRWKFKTGCHIYAMPVLMDSVLLIGSWDTGLYALQRETGQKLWKFQAETGIDQTPLLFNQTIWLASYDSHLYGIDRLTGKLTFDFKAENAFEFGGVCWQNTLIFSGIDRHFYFVDPFQKQVKNVGRSPVAISTQPVVRNDLLITGHYDGSLYSWELPAMQRRLLYRFDKRVLAVLVDDQYLWASSWDRTTVCISLDER